VNVAFNLVKVFSLPALNRSEESAKARRRSRAQARAMAVLARPHRRSALSLVADEFPGVNEAARDDDLIVSISLEREIRIDSELELIRARRAPWRAT